MKITVKIYGRSRFKFANLFPKAHFEGYECNIRFCYFSLKEKISILKNICINEKIAILEIE
jgi:hypothetical protein